MKKLTAIIVAVLTFTLSAVTIYVNEDATGLNNGSSWPNAYKTLQSALNIAVSGNQIWAAEGTYKPSAGGSNGQRDYRFSMIEGVSIYGGFAGTETSISQRVNFGVGEIHETILSGDVGTSGDNTDNSYHVVYNYQSGLSSAAVLDGFTITGGNANDYYYGETSGGGMYNYDHCSPTISNVTFMNNTAYEKGGGMYNHSYCSPIISNVTFLSNTASYDGGEMLVPMGGGMYNSYFSSPAISNSAFISNSASNAGSDYSQGGGLCNTDSSPSIINTKFISNSADLGGGILNNMDCYPVISGVLFSNNSARLDGGGLYNVYTSIYSPQTITNSVFSSNTASNEGGGIYNDYSTQTITNTTFTLNSAAKGGGVSNANTSSPIFNNCILWGNTADYGKQIYLRDGGTATLNYSCYSNSSGDIDDFDMITATNNNITSDPKFIDISNADYRLYSFSPCVNTGNNTYNTEIYDIRGQARIQNTTIDMGAYEWTSGVDPANLIAPSAVTITRGISSTTLGWTGVPGAASYKIYRSEYPSSGFAFLNTTATNSYTDSDVLSGNKYFYYVVAVSAK